MGKSMCVRRGIASAICLVLSGSLVACGFSGRQSGYGSYGTEDPYGSGDSNGSEKRSISDMQRDIEESKQKWEDSQGEFYEALEQDRQQYVKQRAGELGIPLNDPVVEKLLEPVDSQTYQSVVPIHDSSVESVMDNTTISQDTAQMEKPNVATYWRDGLPDEGKAIYDTWYGYLKEGYQQIHLDVPYVGNEQLLSNTWEAVKYDHPELFWVDQGPDPNTGEAASDYTVHYYNDPSKGMDITHHFVCPIEEIPNLAAQIDDAIRQFRSFVGNETNPRQIAIKAAVWLSNRLEYDYSYGNLDQCLLSSLLSDKTVCTGYGAAYKTLLASYDIPCISVVGYAKPTSSSRHMWNAVWVDGKWSSVDVTWLDDDGIGYGWEYFMFAKDENESRNVIGPLNIPVTETIEDIRASGRKQEKALDTEYQSSLNG